MEGMSITLPLKKMSAEEKFIDWETAKQKILEDLQ
jgi:hypothetical protein